ncbi:hypothetical protein C2G38_2035650 [Gigaspora rosea]|uniref:Transmembrane protein n=1 Tax=Gigaspora rosea TaxID=44941 RepID=A0A397VJ77_9GLOM|nr:hypothetical protein C2G38_2035650 [Gigaspora rosea]
MEITGVSRNGKWMKLTTTKKRSNIDVSVALCHYFGVVVASGVVALVSSLRCHHFGGVVVLFVSSLYLLRVFFASSWALVLCLFRLCGLCLSLRHTTSVDCVTSYMYCGYIYIFPKN